MRRNLQHAVTIIALIVLGGPAAMAQGLGGGTTGGGTTGAGGTGAATGTAPGAVLDVDTAFAAVERGNAIGATATTGAGFSTSSNPNGGVGGGGFGGGLGGFGGLGGLGGFGGFGGGFGNTGTTSPPAIRTRLRSAIEVAPVPSAFVQARANQRLYRAPDRAGVDNVGVTFQDGTAIVTGTVASERDRRMSELLMRLEPGVRRVDNRVIVAP